MSSWGYRTAIDVSPRLFNYPFVNREASRRGHCRVAVSAATSMRSHATKSVSGSEHAVPLHM